MKKDMQMYFRLLGYLKPYWKIALFVILGFILNATTEVSTAKLLQYIIDAIQHGNQNHIDWFPVLIVVLMFFRGLGLFIGNYFLAVISRRFIFTIRNEVFAKLNRLPNQYYIDNPVGHITSIILYNIEQLTGATTEALQSIVKDGFTTIALLLYLLYMNWRLTFCIFICVPLIAWIIRQASRRMRKLSVQVQDTMGSINHIIQENLNGQSVVKSYSGQSYEIQRFYQASEDNLRKGLKMVVVQNMNSPLVQLVMTMAMSVIVWIALRPEILGDTTAGEFVSYITAAGLLAKPIKSLTDVNHKIQRGLAAAQSVFDVLDLKEENNQGTLKPTIQGNIQFKEVDFYYHQQHSQVKVIDHVTLNIKAGETVAIVGRSGAGKTSLVNLLLRFQDACSGQILIDGQEINQIELMHLRQNIAVVNQHVILFDRTIKENIAYGQLQHKTDDEIIAAAKAAYAHDFIMQLPQGYDTVLGSQGLNLSGGQRQRLSIARAILKDAPILILDEATSALDNEAEHFIQQAFDQAMQNRTTIVIAHRLSTIENADCIVVMDKGKIIEQGTHQQLLQLNGAYSQLYQRQFKE